MREKRNLIIVLIIFAAGAWGFWAWLLYESPDAHMLWSHRFTSLAIFLVAVVGFVWSMLYEDKLPEMLGHYTGGVFYEENGLCFMPVMRKQGEQAYIYVYFQNRFENDCNAVLHMHPPADSIQHRPDARDIHFSFSCPGGGVGVIQQPVAVHPRLQGQVLDVQMGAAVNYPHSHGDQLRSKSGMPCGTLNVDWGVNFRTGNHELSGEIEMKGPVTVHLPIPREVTNRIRRGQEWRQEIFSRFEK